MSTVVSTVVNWTQDADSNYEVSSAEHLLQIMHKGALYTDAGASPSDYKRSNYKQTADIDLADHHENILPIDLFYNTYDGDNFNIANWSFEDQELAYFHLGLFQYVSGGTLKNINLTGVWTLGNLRSSGIGGLLVGYFSNGEIHNCHGTFDAGTSVGEGGFPSTFGILVGSALGSSVDNLSVKGVIDIVPSRGTLGGIAGNVKNCHVSRLRNSAHFPNNLVARGACGGLIGTLQSESNVFSDFVNTMRGDLVYTGGTAYAAGGLIGNMTNMSNDSANTSFDKFLNAMTGDITSISYASGGIFGSVYMNRGGDGTFTKFANYMSGNITSFQGGGICGTIYVPQENTLTLSDSIVAPRSTVKHAVSYSATSTFTATNVVVSTDFGLTYETDNFGTSTDAANLGVDQGFVSHPLFPVLPYFETDSSEFVFANLKGNSAYEDYTHLTLHKFDITSPYRVGLDIPASNTTVYLSYSNVDQKALYLDDAIETVLGASTGTGFFVYDSTGQTALYGVPPPLTLVTGPLSIAVEIGEVANALAYKLTCTTGTEVEHTIESTQTSHNITNLTPLTSYTIQLYVDNGDGSDFNLVASEDATTLANVASNYAPAQFKNSAGNFSISSVKGNARQSVRQHLNDLFSTGQRVEVDSGRQNRSAYFVKRGESIVVGSTTEAVLIPFDQTAGAAQTVDLVFGHGTVAVAFDEMENTVNVNAETYSTGDSLILDGRKVLVSKY